MSGRLAKYLDDCRTFPADARLGWATEGWRGVGAALAARTVHRIIRSQRLIVYAHPLDRIPEGRMPEGVEIRQLAPGEFARLDGLMSRRELDHYRRVHALGHVCLVAWRGKRPVGYAWVAERIGPAVTRCPVPLPADAAYLWDLYVLPSERGGGVGTALARARLVLARERGFREGWRMIAPENIASIRTLRSADASRVVGEIRFLQLFSVLRARFIPSLSPTGP